MIRQREVEGIGVKCIPISFLKIYMIIGILKITFKFGWSFHCNAAFYTVSPYTPRAYVFVSAIVALATAVVRPGWGRPEKG